MSEKTAPSPVFHGRLNLEQQRKRAKELLKAAKSGDADGLQRLQAGGYDGSSPPRLSDAQHAIARETGFPSWPRLKHHIQALDFARDHVGRNGDRDQPTVHIRCGSDIRQGLRIAGFEGDFLEFADPFCVGPLPALPLEQHLRSRAHFLAAYADVDEADALARERREYGALEDLGGYRRIVLWFEHDSYDQLVLAYILKRLGVQQLDASIELIAVDRIPGVKRFVGLGQLSPDLLAWLWDQRMVVGEPQFELGARAWEALTAPDPRPLHTLATQPAPQLPLLPAALKRHLQELPDLETGLSLSETLALEIARDLGPITLGRAFGELTRYREPLPYQGDTMFGQLAESLARASVPLLHITPPGPEQRWYQAVMALTDAGQRVLEGNAHHLDQDPEPRWVGGVLVPGEGGSWCWDRKAQAPTWRKTNDKAG